MTVVSYYLNTLPKSVGAEGKSVGNSSRWLIIFPSPLPEFEVRLKNGRQTLIAAQVKQMTRYFNFFDYKKES